jgi:hypothetical protein
LTYATVGTVRAAALLGGLVDLNVLDNQVAGVETLGIGVGLGVLEKAEEELSRLDGPPGAGDTPGLAYCETISAFVLHPFFREFPVFQGQLPSPIP